MIKLFQNKSDIAKGGFSASFHSKKHFYDIVNTVKKHPSNLVEREWKLNLTDFDSLIEDLEAIKKETIHVDLQIVHSHLDTSNKRKELLDLRNSLTGYDSGIVFNEPFEPLPFQHVGIEVISKIKFGLIADKVGLGKTIQGFGSAMRLRDDKVITKSIVVATSTLKKKWCNDIKKFTQEGTILLEASPAKRIKIFKEWLDSDKLFLVTSYDTLRNDWHSYMKKLIKGVNYGLVLDELQKIKNTRAQRSKIIKDMATGNLCKSVVGLSATYIETGLQDLFGVMFVVDPTVFGSSYITFSDNYLEFDWWGNVKGTKNIKGANSKMKYSSVRRTKPMVKDQLKAHLPKVNESTLWVELSKDEKRCYNDVVDGIIDKFEDTERAAKITTALPMTLSLLVRQASLSTEMLGYKIKKSSKVEALLEMLPEIIESEKVVIFCFFTGFLDIIERELNKKGIKTMTIHGKRKEANIKVRQDNVDAWQEDPNCNVLLASDILAEGVDIPKASYVINMDTLWNPAKMTQRAGRIDRLIQEAENIYVIHMLTKGTVEESMYETVYERYKLALEVMDDGKEETRIRKLSYADMKKMILRKV